MGISPPSGRALLIGSITQQLLEGLDGLALHRSCYVRVQVEGDADLRVAEHLTHDLRMHTHAELRHRRTSCFSRSST